MKSKHFKKSLMILAALITLLLAATTVRADNITKNITTYMSSNSVKHPIPYILSPYSKNYSNMNIIFNYSVGEKITILSNSNPNVVKTVLYKRNGDNTLDVIAKKPGKATLRFRFGGDKYTYNITIKKYTPAISSLKIGKTNLTSKFKKTYVIYLPYSKYKNKKFTLKCTPKKGWKVDDAKYYIFTDRKNVKKTKFQTYQLGSESFKITSKNACISFSLSKGKETCTYYIAFK